MNKKEYLKETSEYKITVSAKKDKWLQIQKNVFSKEMKKLKLDGFRKGKVPESIAKKHISKALVISNSANEILNTLSEEALKDLPKDKMALDGPVYKIIEMDANNLIIEFIYPLYPEVKLGDYSKIETKYTQVEVLDKEIIEEIEKLIKSKSMKMDTNKPIKKDDIVIFDYEGLKNGVSFEGGSSEGAELVIGEGKFIEGFEEKMIGLKKDDKKDINITFPKDYGHKNLNGKDVVFKLDIKSVQVIESPVLNDEFVKSLEIKDISTVENLKIYLKYIQNNENEITSRISFKENVVKEIRKNSEFTLPAQLIYKESQNIKKQFKDKISKQGIKWDEYIKLSGIEEKNINSQFTADAVKRLDESIIFSEISKIEKLEISEKEYEKEYEKLSKVYSHSVDSIKNIISKEQIQIPMINDKILNILIKKSKKS